jgi:hypothetical protein
LVGIPYSKQAHPAGKHETSNDPIKRNAQVLILVHGQDRELGLDDWQYPIAALDKLLSKDDKIIEIE